MAIDNLNESLISKLNEKYTRAAQSGKARIDYEEFKRDWQSKFSSTSVPSCQTLKNYLSCKSSLTKNRQYRNEFCNLLLNMPYDEASQKYGDGILPEGGNIPIIVSRNVEISDIMQFVNNLIDEENFGEEAINKLIHKLDANIDKFLIENGLHNQAKEIYKKLEMKIGEEWKQGVKIVLYASAISQIRIARSIYEFSFRAISDSLLKNSVEEIFSTVIRYCQTAIRHLHIFCASSTDSYSSDFTHMENKPEVLVKFLENLIKAVHHENELSLDRLFLDEEYKERTLSALNEKFITQHMIESQTPLNNDLNFIYSILGEGCLWISAVLRQYSFTHVMKDQNEQIYSDISAIAIALSMYSQSMFQKSKNKYLELHAMINQALLYESRSVYYLQLITGDSGHNDADDSRDELFDDRNYKNFKTEQGRSIIIFQQMIDKIKDFSDQEKAEMRRWQIAATNSIARGDRREGVFLLEKALREHKRALNLAEQDEHVNGWEYAIALKNRSDTYSYLQRTELAIEDLRKAVVCNEQQENDSALIISLELLAKAYYLAGQYDLSITQFRRVIDHPLVSSSYSGMRKIKYDCTTGIADAYEKKGDYKKSSEYLRQRGDGSNLPPESILLHTWLM
jgi:tetratricopeptide (TPR) repeat protein